MTTHIQDDRQARKRRRLGWTALGAVSLTAVLPRCTAPAVNYGVGNDLAGRTPPLGPGVTVSDATPPGILDANCGGPPCSVSWTTDIFPNMESTGPWQCASSGCHGGGATQPAIDDGDPDGTYASLATYAGITPTYIIPCNTIPSSCSILCNLTANGCGNTMPIGSGTPLTQDQLTMIQTWIGCGSPLN
ncbi:MAG TPA: hypothetical protein VEK07_20265 [Polyangiaceae bacterium]|nr:hypothetical protein [Polyangiaceae bacterium]